MYIPIPAGVIIKPRVGGERGAYQYQSRNPSLQYPSPPGLSQTSYSPFVVDSNACVSYGQIDSIESQLMQLFGSTQLFSRRALAVMSGTDPLEGNDVVTVFNTIKEKGLIPLEYWPELKSFTREEYYAPIPAEVLAKAIKLDVSLKQWIPASDLTKALAEAPVNAIITDSNPSHFITIINPDQFFDSEGPQIRQNSSTTFHSYWQITLNKEHPIMLDKITVNLGGRVGIFTYASDPSDLPALNSVFGTDLKPNPDGSITTQETH